MRGIIEHKLRLRQNQLIIMSTVGKLISQNSARNKKISNQIKNNITKNNKTQESLFNGNELISVLGTIPLNNFSKKIAFFLLLTLPCKPNMKGINMKVIQQDKSRGFYRREEASTEFMFQYTGEINTAFCILFEKFSENKLFRNRTRL